MYDDHDDRRVVQGYGGGSRCLESMSGHHPGARDDLSGSLLFGRSNNDRLLTY